MLVVWSPSRSLTDGDEFEEFEYDGFELKAKGIVGQGIVDEKIYEYEC